MNNFNQSKFPKPKPILKPKSERKPIPAFKEKVNLLTQELITHSISSEIIRSFPVSEERFFDKYSLPHVQKLTDYRMYYTPEIIAKLEAMDYSEGGFLLFEGSMDNEQYSNGLDEFFRFKNADQAIQLMEYLQHSQYDLEGFIGGWAKTQAIFFGSSMYDYPVNSNF